MPLLYGRCMKAVNAELLRSGRTEDIALTLLRGFGGEGTTVSGYNTLIGAQSDFSGEPDVQALVGRLGDAWAWLVAHQCVGQGVQTSATWQRVTRQGAAIAANPNALVQLHADTLLSSHLSPQLVASAKPAFGRGDYETAAFAAMKAVEVEVRRLSGLPAGLVGVKLMQEAFKTDGRLVDPSAEAGEQVATMQLFMGAMGAFKNPASHRTVLFDDPLEAAEVVQLADLLLRMLKRVAARVTATPGSQPSGEIELGGHPSAG